MLGCVSSGMDSKSPDRSPREDGELEDGEICDDDTDESVPGRRAPGGGGPRSRPRINLPRKPPKMNQHPHNLRHPPPDFRRLIPYNLGPHPHGPPFPPGHRPPQQCGPSGPERPPPGLGPHGGPDANARSSFWERSHGALGRFRHQRAVPNGGRGRGERSRGNWGGDGGGSGAGGGWETGNLRLPPGRYGAGDGHCNMRESPPRKQKQSGRNQVRKVVHGAAKPDNSVDETFEDLLSKYKQIQLELECIRKEETKALEPAGSPSRDQSLDTPTSIPDTKPAANTESVPEPASIQNLGAMEEVPDQQREERKVFQAFNIKPLRQKLLTPPELDALKKKLEEEGGEAEAEPGPSPKPDAKETQGDPPQPVAASLEGDGEPKEDGAKAEVKQDGEEELAMTKKCDCASDEKEKAERKKCCSVCRELSTSSEDSTSSPDKPAVKGKMEEEELSELQLRLLALQSASKKWHQKEQQVMKASKERMTKASQDKSSGPGAAAPVRQRVTTRSTTSAAAANRVRTRSTPLERDRDRAKPGTRLAERDRDRERAKPGLKPPAERGRTPAKKLISPRSTAKQAARKQQLRTWKLQQQRDQEENRRQEEDERRKREDEIRKIRDLSNQDEQYNRFMKLVGAKAQPRSKSWDREHRKSLGKQGLDASGNLYQYDNYDEVAMETDSEPSSPVSSPAHTPFAADGPTCVSHMMSCYPVDSLHLGMELVPSFISPTLPGITPPPPPPLPPPLEETPPPKPPFADEEEEEEMLLRETCLMSMATKRTNAPEESSASAPASPASQATAGVQLAARGNLSTVSLNTVPQPRGKKFSRGHHVPRAPLVLPRHKAVVIQLNVSEDSDSDVDTCSSMQGMFGGLESMIKEARRTVEAAKPKGATGSEKENNPVRTPEALSDAKKVEYRLLKEEIAREKQRILKEQSHSPRGAASPAASDSELDSSAKATAELQLSMAEERLTKHRALLHKDEAMLRQLLQQELKKRESLKAAEAKVDKLKEQLLASEKIVSANKTLLKKLKEQVCRVEHRVSIKKSLAVGLEEELAQAQTAVGRGLKRRMDSNQLMPGKLQRVDGGPRGAERHFAELIAQKQRLQQLESEYALKIQKLKEAQARRNRAGALEPAPPAASPPLVQPVVVAAVPPPPPPSSPFPLPQPSLHDLTQDKLTLDSEDVAENEEHEAEQATANCKGVSVRRQSFRQSNSSTKPKLEQLGSTATKDSTAKQPKASKEPPEMFAGLDVESLKERYQHQAELGELLLREIRKLGEDVEHPPNGKVMMVDAEPVSGQSGSLDLKPTPFGSYHSPLLAFKAYRFSPYYRTKEKLSLSSVTYSNTVDPRTSFCRFDLTGTCNDDDCRWQHMRNCTLSGNQLFQDILSYNLPLIGCSDGSSDEDVKTSTEKYIKKLFGANKDRMGMDQKAVLLVSKVNESKRHVPPYTTCKDIRRWRPKPMGLKRPGPAGDSGDESGDDGLSSDIKSKSSLSVLDVCVTPDDKRYFATETDDISNLESSVVESPRDAQLWIKLAFKYLSQQETSASECLEAALNTLSRALEDNADNPEIWCHYLALFSRRGSRQEVQEMCEMAVEHAPSHQVWWSYLNLETSFEGKDYVCDRLLQYLCGAAASCGAAEKLSFQLLEALLYRVDLNLFTGRMESALTILQNALKSASEQSIAQQLMASDRAQLWLSYIHLTEFDRLPCSLYDPVTSSPSRLVSREPFQLPWRTPGDISTPPDILIALFEDAIHQCTDEMLPQGERTQACMLLHTNLIYLNKLLERFSAGILRCESLLQLCPESCELRDTLADLHMIQGNGDQAVSMWLHTLADCPYNAEVFYHTCKFLMDQEKPGAVSPLFRGFVLSLCDDEQSQTPPVDVLRHILGIPTAEILKETIIKKDLEDPLRLQKPYLHLVHCRWQWLTGSVEEAIDAFERALGSAMQLEVLHKLWMDYLEFGSRQACALQYKTLFSSLVQRCLCTVPSRLQVPFSPAQYWSCYRFHNKVVRFYLSCLPQSQHALVLEKLRYAMPNNTELGLRLLHQEWRDDNAEHLKFQARLLTGTVPKCLAIWKIAIAAERGLTERSEVRHLYRQVLRHLPLCAALWKDRLLFEAAEGGNTDKLRKLVDKCQELGVSLSEPLSLGLGRAQGDGS